MLREEVRADPSLLPGLHLTPSFLMLPFSHLPSQTVGEGRGYQERNIYKEMARIIWERGNQCIGYLKAQEIDLEPHDRTEKTETPPKKDVMINIYRAPTRYQRPRINRWNRHWRVKDGTQTEIKVQGDPHRSSYNGGRYKTILSHQNFFQFLEVAGSELP